MRIKTINKRKKAKMQKDLYCDGNCNKLTSPGRCYPSTLWEDIKGSPNYGRCWRCGKKLHKVFIVDNHKKRFIGYL